MSAQDAVPARTARRSSALACSGSARSSLSAALNRCSARPRVAAARVAHHGAYDSPVQISTQGLQTAGIKLQKCRQFDRRQVASVVAANEHGFHKEALPEHGVRDQPPEDSFYPLLTHAYKLIGINTLPGPSAKCLPRLDPGVYGLKKLQTNQAQGLDNS